MLEAASFVSGKHLAAFSAALAHVGEHSSSQQGDFSGRRWERHMHAALLCRRRWPRNLLFSLTDKSDVIMI